MEANTGSLIILMLFAISLVATYFAVRLSWVRLPNASIIGGIVNVTLLTLYSTSQGNTLFQAVTIALALGLLFTLMSVSAGAYFLAQASAPTREKKGQPGK
jgi:hypothetical protein